MGIRCSCGVTVGAIATNVNVRFDDVTGNERGNLTYTANVCADTLQASTLSLVFEQTSAGTDRSFTFVANEITSVTCRQEGQNCVITVNGFGTDGRAFTAVFRDQVPPAAVDIVTEFEIINFFAQTGSVTVPQGSIRSVGCF